MFNSVGRHVTLDLHWDEQSPVLVNPEILMTAMRAAITDANATILHEHTNDFNGGGFTGLFVLAESHASVHTWPEHGIATLDVFMCGDCDAFEAVTDIVNNLKESGHDPDSKLETKIFRGFYLRKKDTERDEET